MDSLTTLRETLDLVRANAEHAHRRGASGVRQGHPRGHAYADAYLRRYAREKAAKGGDYAKASPALICLASRLIDLIDGLGRT